MLEILSITASYPSTHGANQAPAAPPRPVLQDISLQLAPGQIMALIGPNGAGKSSLIKTLSGELPLQAGSIRVDGQDLAHLAPQARARRIAFVPQAIQLPPAFTALETVLLGRTPYLGWLGQVSPKDEEVARRAMQLTRTTALAGRRVGELSGGEQQRVLLARALAQATPLLVMDEPTAHLDLKYQLSLLDMVQSLARQENLAVLIALHDLNLVARYATHVALLVEGRLQASGLPRDVLTPTTLTRAYSVPLQVLNIGKNGMPVITPTIA